MSQHPHLEMRSVCLPRHPAVAYLFLVRRRRASSRPTRAGPMLVTKIDIAPSNHHFQQILVLQRRYHTRSLSAEAQEGTIGNSYPD